MLIIKKHMFLRAAVLGMTAITLMAAQPAKVQAADVLTDAADGEMQSSAAQEQISAIAAAKATQNTTQTAASTVAQATQTAALTGGQASGQTAQNSAYTAGQTTQNAQTAALGGTQTTQNNASAVSTGSNINFVGINLDPSQGDFLGVEQQQEELLIAGRLALEELESESEYAKLAIADVDSYVNIRDIPSTDGKILGKIYKGAVAHVIETAGEENDWLHVTSGSVEGYIKAEYFIYGRDAVAVIDDYVTRYAVVQASRLNVRKEATSESGRIGYLDNGEKARIVENDGSWVKVEYTEGKYGYVFADFIEVEEEFSYAISIEEERAEQARLRALEERKKQQEAKTPENKTIPAASKEIIPAQSYSTNAELRDSIAEYALQFVGNRYVAGGNSLTNGTDCSGFTKLVFAEFGYSLGRTTTSQYSSAGRLIPYSEAQKGDILCYSSNGGKSCTHVAIYLGDGQIVHAATPKKGICKQQDQFDIILGAVNVID